MVTATSRAARRRTALALAAAGLVAGCGEYARTNPYDPEADVTFTIAGPDTSWTLLDNLTFTATVSPSVPGMAIEWLADDPTMLAPRGAGQYQTQHTGVTTVIVRVGRHEGTHTVVIRQRAEQVFFRCAAPPCAARPPVGQQRTIAVDQFDRFASPMEAGQELRPVSYVIRDPSIATIVAGSGQPSSVTVRGVAAGTTWIVATMQATAGPWIDSLPVIVPSP